MAVTCLSMSGSHSAPTAAEASSRYLDIRDSSRLQRLGAVNLTPAHDLKWRLSERAKFLVCCTLR